MSWLIEALELLTALELRPVNIGPIHPGSVADTTRSRRDASSKHMIMTTFDNLPASTSNDYLFTRPGSRRSTSAVRNTVKCAPSSSNAPKPRLT